MNTWPADAHHELGEKINFAVNFLGNFLKFILTSWWILWNLQLFFTAKAESNVDACSTAQHVNISLARHMTMWCFSSTDLRSSFAWPNYKNEKKKTRHLLHLLGDTANIHRYTQICQILLQIKHSVKASFLFRTWRQSFIKPRPGLLLSRVEAPTLCLPSVTTTKKKKKLVLFLQLMR